MIPPGLLERLARVAATETPDKRPKCGYNTNASDSVNPIPCGSEKGLNRIFMGDYAGGTPGGIVCDEHRVKVWTHHDVNRIEPLDRTTK
jgi:hypothetical protein